MTLLWRALTVFVWIFSAHGAASAMEPVPSGELSEREYSRMPSWTIARPCNGMSEHTRTICCGTNPAGGCGKRLQGDIVPHEADHETDNSVRHQSVAPLTRRSGDQFLMIVRDPMLYICVMTSITVIYLAALAGSGRDNGTEEGV
jgi:hypothetical protein